MSLIEKRGGVFIPITLVLIASYFVSSHFFFKKINKQMVSGTKIGFIRSIDSENQKISFDDAVWLTGKEGQDAAIAHGVCTEVTRKDCLPNDYFILNETPDTVSLKLDADVRIIMKTWNTGDAGIMNKDIDLLTFDKLINSNDQWNKLPYTITIDTGEVENIEEIYIP